MDNITEGFYFLNAGKKKAVPCLVQRAVAIMGSGQDSLAVFELESPSVGLGISNYTRSSLVRMGVDQVTSFYRGLCGRLQTLKDLSCAENEEVRDEIGRLQKQIDSFPETARRVGYELKLD